MTTQNPENTFPYLSGRTGLRVANVMAIQVLLKPLLEAIQRAGRGELFNTTTEQGMQLYATTAKQRRLCVRLPEVVSHLGELLTSVLVYDDVFTVTYDAHYNEWIIDLF